jgi:hypothetical protein
MHIRCCSLALALLALAGCKKREAPTPDPSASAAPPATTATATATVTATATASASAAPVPAAEVTHVSVALAHDGQVVYLHIKHPNVPAADVLNRLFKSEADKQVNEARVYATPGTAFRYLCEGGFPTDDVFWERCDVGGLRDGARCPWMWNTHRAWSLAGPQPERLDLKAQMTGDWVAAVDASCVEQFAGSRDPWTTFSEMFGMTEQKPNWRPEKNVLVLSVPQIGSCDPDRQPECEIPWDRLASFVKPGSPLKLIADKAPPGPRLIPVEERPPRSPPEDPGGRPGGLPGDPAQKACDDGDARACVKVAEALFSGKNGTQQPELARWMFWKACNAGEPTGCVNLGWSYLNDRESTPAGLTAAPYFGKACTDTVALGCLGLGTIYRDGRSTSKDPKRAAELFTKACEGGVKAACAMAKAKP